MASTPLTDTIANADAILMVTPYSVTYDSNSHTASYTVTGVGRHTGAAGSSVTLNTTHTDAGTYSDSWSFSGGPNYNDIASTPITDTIAKADATVVYTGYMGGTYDSNAHTQTVTVTGVGSDGQLFSDSLTGTNAGSYSKAWSFSNDNYNASGESGTLAFDIAKADATVSVTGYMGGSYDSNAHTQTVT